MFWYVVYCEFVGVEFVEFFLVYWSCDGCVW